MPPWDKYQQAAPQGDPVIARDPYRVNAETRANRDQQLQEQAARRADEDQAMQRQKFQADIDQREKDRQAGVNAAARESENKAAAFLIRALGANKSYEGADVGARSYAGQKLADIAPDILNSLPGGVGNSPDRQISDSAQDEFIAASLRQDSGAAIPDAELARQRRIYFPMPGDGPEVIEQKRQARLRAIEGLKLSAGRLEGEAEKRYGELTSDPKVVGGLTGDGTTDGPPEGQVLLGYDKDKDGNPYPVYGAPGTSMDTPSGGGGGGIRDLILGRTPMPTERSIFGSSLADIDARDTGLLGLARQGVTLGLSDEAAGLGGFFGGLLTGENPVAAYNRENSRVDQGLAATRQASPVVGNGLEILAGGGAARVGAGINSLTQGARVGAGLGAIGGYGYGEGATGSTINALAGGALGGVLGAGTQWAGNALAARAANRAQPNMEVVAAGQRQNIPVRQPDARPELRGRYAAAESGQNSGPAIRAARAADADAIEARVAEVGGQGTASDPYALGGQVRAAGERYIARTRGQANRLYDRARQLAGGQTVTARNADAVIDGHIRELTAAGENSNSAAIGYLQGLRDDIDRGLTIESLQNIRSNMRGQISERGLTGTDTERRVGQVIDAITQDMADQLPRGASRALRAADGFYRERQEFINGTLKQLMGSRGNPVPAETAASRLVSMTKGKGNYDRFAGMWRELEPAEQADAAATIAQSLGRRQNGEFSPALLIKSLDPRNGLNPRTAQLVFGQDGAQALNDLRILSQAKGEALSRQSPSGQAIMSSANGLRSLLLGGFGLSTGGPAGAVAVPVAANIVSRLGEQRAARLLLNPDFTRWLRAAPNTTNPAAIDRYFGQLGGISSIAANDNQAFVSALRESFSRSPGRAAAQDESPSRREPPR